MTWYPTPWDCFDPEWHATGYSPRDALALALACQLTYEHDEALCRKHLKAWGFRDDDIRFVATTSEPTIDLATIVAAREDLVLIAFRGAISDKNWFACIQGSLDPGPLIHTRVHEGFQKTLFPGVFDLAHILAEESFTGRPIWITGHSLGGALALLFAAMLIRRNRPVGGIYTFATPRMGDRQFARTMEQAYKGPLWRVVNERDPIPHLPPEPFFTHFGNRRLLKAEADQAADSELSTWTRLCQEFVRLLGGLTDGEFIVGEAHRLSTEEGYLPRLIRDVNEPGTVASTDR